MPVKNISKKRTIVVRTKRTISPKRGVHYVNNLELLKGLIEYKASVNHANETGVERPMVTQFLGECIMKIATHLAYKPNFSNYTYRDDMICDGIENCLQYIDNFDPKKSKNPFAYFTQIIYFAFVRRIQKEKRYLFIKYKAIDNANIQQETSDHQNSDSSPRHHDIYSGEWSHEQMYAFIEDFETTKRKKRTVRKSQDKINTIDDVN